MGDAIHYKTSVQQLSLMTSQFDANVSTRTVQTHALVQHSIRATLLKQPFQFIAHFLSQLFLNTTLGLGLKSTLGQIF